VDEHERSETVVEVISADAQPKGWLAAGRLDPFCGSCGAVYMAIERAIPIELAAYPCPNCATKDALTYRVLRVERTDDHYIFAAALECAKCTRKTMFRRALDGLSRIVRVKIAPTGIEIEMQGQSG
jgi:hypothetical protein